MNREAAVRWHDAVGAVVWVGVAGLAWSGVVEVTLTEVLLLLGILVIVPGILPLHPATPRPAAAVAMVAALPVVAALALPQGPGAAALVAPWVGVAAASTLLALRWWWRGGLRIRAIVWPAAAAYLVVGAAWLLADRAGLEPVGIRPPIVQLTAVHFHYAGFVAAVLAGRALAWTGPRNRVAMAATAGVVAGPPIVAAGFTVVPPLQVAGAVVITIGLYCLSWVTLRHVVPATDRLTGAALAVSALAVIIPMVLAVQWALGHVAGTPALSIPDMVMWHGVANAFGFSLLGAIGWRRAHVGVGAAHLPEHHAG